MDTRKRALLLRIAGVLLLAGTLGARELHPDFSGQWVAVSRPALASFGSSFTATQTVEALTIHVEMAGVSDTVTYRLDGQQTRHVRGSYQTRSVTSWDGNRLVIVTKDDRPGSEELKRVLRLSASGKELTIDSTRGSSSTQSLYAKQVAK